MGSEEGVVRAYDVRRMPDDQKWDGDLINKLKGAPAKPDPNKDGIHIPVRVHVDDGDKNIAPEDVDQRRAEPEYRRVQIAHHMLQKYGYTEGCD